MNIKELDQSFLQQLLNIQEEANPTYFQKDDPNSFLKHLNTDQGFILGYFIENELVAYARYWFPGNESVMGKEAGLSQKQLSRLVYFNGTVVKKSYRGKGIQYKLHKQVLDILNYRGISYIMCMIHPENKASIKNIQEKLKFKRVLEKDIYQSKRAVFLKKL